MSVLLSAYNFKFIDRLKNLVEHISRASLLGSILPIAIVASLIMLIALSGLLLIWERGKLIYLQGQRYKQANADVESAYVLYRLHPDDKELTAKEGYCLSNSRPYSLVRVYREQWGLYEAVRVETADSLAIACRLLGLEPDMRYTLYYLDNRQSVTLAGRTELQGILYLPQNGVKYGRIGSENFSGRKISDQAIQYSRKDFPTLDSNVLNCFDSLWARERFLIPTRTPNKLVKPFYLGATEFIRIDDSEIYDCILKGRIILYADSIYIDSSCCIENLIIVARKIVVGKGTHISAQLFARDTVIVESNAELSYPSGVWCTKYIELQEQSEVNGYVMICTAKQQDQLSICYRQARMARLRGLLWVNGAAQVQGIIAGCVVIGRAIYYTTQGYYKDMFCDFTLLENSEFGLPIGVGLSTMRRKEVAWVE